jgi:hypothetical protein
MKAFRNITLLSLALAATLAITPLAKADPYINGSVDVSTGNDNWTGSQLNFRASLLGYVLDATGNLANFTTTPPTSVTISASPLVFGSPSTPIVFTFVQGGITGTFTFSDVSIITDNGSVLSLNGDGWLTETGYARTYAVFTASGSDSSGSSGTTASSGIDFNIVGDESAIPEPGSLVLFGTGLLGLAGMLRNKYARSR